MISSWSEEILSVLSVGRSLEAEGTNNYALTRPQALQALEQFEDLGIPMLGGDVRHEVNGELLHNYNNWSCNRNKLETDQEYVCRSIAVARNYIQNYPKPDVFFELVPGLSRS